MKRLSILLLALLLAVSLIFVSCESNPNKENTEQKTEAEGKEFNEVTASAVMEGNKELAGELEPYIKTIDGIMKNPDDITSLVVKLRIQPKNSGDTFSFTTAEDYKAYKSCLEKYNETADTKDKAYIPADSELVPKKYKYIEVTWDAIPDKFAFSYETDKKVYNVNDLDYGKTNDNPLGMDAQCFECSTETDPGVTDYSPLISSVLEIAKVTPTLKGSVEIVVKGTTYVLSFSESLSSEGKSIILVDNISIKKGETTLASFKCRSSVKFSDDFSFVDKYDAEAMKYIPAVKGSVTLSFSGIELLLGDGTYSLTGSIDGTLDFTTQRVVVNCTLTEKIKNIEFIALDITFDITKAVIEKADNVDAILDCLKIYTFRVGGTEYSAESLKKYISTLLSEKAAE